MPPVPVTFILFGATGDLAQKKLFPALNELFVLDLLHPDSRIIAVSRRTWDDETFRAFLNESNPSLSGAFLARIEYAEVELGIGVGYGALAERLAGDTRERLVYCSLPPTFMPAVIEELRRFEIVTAHQGKLLLEKPFGTDESSAKQLNALLLSFLNETQIYRVDHYLGKATVQALMKLHEKHDGLRILLSNTTVSGIRVELLEMKGIETRGASYDSVGAFRDVGQNHMLILLSVLMAEYPHEVSVTAWQGARAEVLEALGVSEAENALARGQYTGYKDAPGVAENSETETAFIVQACFHSGELSGIPVTLHAGKMMPENRAAITITFKDIPNFPTHMECIIQPSPRILFRYPDGHEVVTEIPEAPDAYASIMSDALLGERQHFVGTREVLASWRYTDALLQRLNREPLRLYSHNNPFI